MKRKMWEHESLPGTRWFVLRVVEVVCKYLVAGAVLHILWEIHTILCEIADKL